MVYNGYYKVMCSIPKMGHLTTPVTFVHFSQKKEKHDPFCELRINMDQLFLNLTCKNSPTGFAFDPFGITPILTVTNLTETTEA